jgi:hypothetical protein
MSDSYTRYQNPPKIGGFWYLVQLSLGTLMFVVKEGDNCRKAKGQWSPKVKITSRNTKRRDYGTGDAQERGRRSSTVGKGQAGGSWARRCSDAETGR